MKKNPQKFYIAIKVIFNKMIKDGNKTGFFPGTMHTLLRDAFESSLQKFGMA